MNGYGYAIKVRGFIWFLFLPFFLSYIMIIK